MPATPPPPAAGHREVPRTACVSLNRRGEAIRAPIDYTNVGRRDYEQSRDPASKAHDW